MATKNGTKSEFEIEVHEYHPPNPRDAQFRVVAKGGARAKELAQMLVTWYPGWPLQVSATVLVDTKAANRACSVLHAAWRANTKLRFVGTKDGNGLKPVQSELEHRMPQVMERLPAATDADRRVYALFHVSQELDGLREHLDCFEDALEDGDLDEALHSLSDVAGYAEEGLRLAKEQGFTPD